MSTEQRRSSGALVFHRSTNQPPASIEVDWDDVERNLNDIDGAFGNPNFDPLRHVLGLLAAVTADKRLEEARLGCFASSPCSVIITIIIIHFNTMYILI
jgi:hypothetical protein